MVVPVDPLFLFGVIPVENELFSWHNCVIYRLHLQGKIVQNVEVVTAHFITYSTIKELVD